MSSSPVTGSKPDSTQSTTLRSGAIGAASQLFQSIAHIGPATGVIFALPFMVSKGGGAMPLAAACAMVCILLTGLCLRELVTKVRSAGGYFTIHSVALGHFAGFTTSWLWFLDEPLVPAALSTIFGQVFSDFAKSHLSVNIPWWVVTLVMIIGLTWISYIGVKQSARVTISLASAELVIMTVLGVLLVIDAGSHQVGAAFTPSASPHHWGGVFFATVFGITALIGFESGIPLSEETHNAGRSLTRAIVISIIAIGAFFIFLGYATVAGWGFPSAAKFASSFSGASDPYFTLATHAFGAIGPWIILFALLNGTWGVGLAGQNAVTRVYYALGRDGIFPKQLAATHPVHRTPHRAIALQGLLSIAIAMFLGFKFGPVNAFGLAALLMTLSLIIIYIVTNVSCFVLYRRDYRAEFRWGKHFVLPLVATVVIIFPFIASIAPQVFFDFSNSYPLTLAGPILGVWFVIGLAFYAYLRARKPGELHNLTTEMAFADFDGDLVAGAPPHRPTLEPTPSSGRVLVRRNQPWIHFKRPRSSR
jgi:amino acid transporter